MTMYSISKEFHFSASHILEGLPEGHPCGRLHGHNYIIIIELSSEELDETGFVQDYGGLTPIKDYIDKVLDHRHLNDVWKQIQPSAENIARTIYMRFTAQFPKMTAVTVKETEKTIATFRP